MNQSINAAALQNELIRKLKLNCSTSNVNGNNSSNNNKLIKKRTSLNNISNKKDVKCNSCNNISNNENIFMIRIRNLFNYGCSEHPFGIDSENRLVEDLKIHVLLLQKIYDVNEIIAFI